MSEKRTLTASFLVPPGGALRPWAWLQQGGGLTYGRFRRWTFGRRERQIRIIGRYGHRRAKVRLIPESGPHATKQLGLPWTTSGWSLIKLSRSDLGCEADATSNGIRFFMQRQARPVREIRAVPFIALIRSA